MKKWPILVAVAASVAAAIPVARASIVRAMDLADLTAAAERVVVADVAKVESQWDKDHRRIYTTVEIRVQESWKGTTPSDGTIVFHQPGGSVGEIEMSVVGMPRFSVGEKAVLFLEHARVVGLAQGKRPLHWDAIQKRWFAEPADTTGTVTVDRQGRIRAAERNTSETLDSLRAKVRALLGN
jgi:hypothetical protein